MIETLYEILDDITEQKKKIYCRCKPEYQKLIHYESAIKEAIFRLENNCLDK